MKNSFFIALAILTLNIQAQDSLLVKKENLKLKNFILPTALVVTGAVLKIPTIQKNIQEKAQQTFGNDFHTKADDYTQFVPAAQVLLGKSLGFTPKHGYKQQIANLAVSNLAVGGVTFLSKTAFQDMRPDGSAKNSFPSGHTATAFNNATLLFLEYKDSNIWYASSGYLFATATGVLRVANNRHWSGDVVAGAGIGIAIGTLVNYWNPFHFDQKQNKKVSFIGYPFLNDKTTGLGLLCTIN